MLFRLNTTIIGGSPIRSLQYFTRGPPLSWHCCQYRHRFHSKSIRRAAATNHYETLGLSPNASQADIKKTYYRLSKSTHPDRNPGDPSASTRFSAVSDAYATLGNVEKRARYDRDVLRTHGSRDGTGVGSRPGSYSSTQAGPNGSRPASGLSRRRSPFQGPPPSFYEAGGYGAYGSRASQAEANAQNAKRSAGSEYRGGGWTDAGSSGGFSPGQGAQRGFDNDVPHFDRDSHYRTQESVLGKTASRKKRLYREYADSTSPAGMGTIPSFILISFVVTVTLLVPVWLTTNRQTEKKKGNV